MIRIKKYLVIILTIIVGFSCSSEDNTTEQQNSNFYALTVGNSWEYKYYLKDVSTNEFLPTPVTETVDITETIVIDNNTYFNFKHTVTGNDGSYVTLPDNSERNFKLRDSSGFLIDDIGLINYNNSNNDEYFVDHLDSDLSYYLALEDINDDITTNAGSFICYDNHYYLKDSNGNLSNSLDHVYREDGKGEILRTLSLASQIEPFAHKRLEFYTLE